MSQQPSASFWSGKRVFVTSPTSFLGAWTSLTLQHLGAQVFGFSEEAPSSPSLFDLANLGQTISMTYGDLRNESSVTQALQFAQADVLLHLGDMGSIAESKLAPVDVISKTVLGTTNLLELLRETASIRSVVVLSSDKVYLPDPENRPQTEENRIGAREIGPTAKLCSELIALSYRQSFFSPEKYNKHKVALATARVGVGIGGGDFSETSLVSQAVQSFLGRGALELRNPQSVRPWIHVLDQVCGVLLLAQSLYEKGPKLAATYNLGASEFESVAQVVDQLKQAWGGGGAGVSSTKTSLSLHGQMNSDLAQKDLGWVPRWRLPKMFAETARWYRDFYSGASSQHQLTAGLREYFK